MATQFDMQKLGKDNVDVALKSFGATSKGVQAIAAETAEFSKKSFESVSAVAEKLVAVKTLDKAFEIQSEYVKSAYEGFVAYATKVGEMYSTLAKDSVKPYEGMFAKATAAAK